MKKHLLLIFTALLPLVASAEKVEIDGIWYNLISKAKVAEVTFKGDSYNSYYDEYSGSITIPATVTYEGATYSVKSIGDYAFYDCSYLYAINIPKGVTSIGNSAFYGCSGLTTITLPKSVTSIGGYAFFGCYNLESINIPEGVTSIGEYAFSSCSSLTAINIPEGVTSIEWCAFYRCTSLTAITLPEGLTRIGDYAFEDCSRLSKVINCSNLSLTKGSSSNGYVAYYAKVVYQGGELTTVGDFQFYTSDGIHSLVNYIGNDTEIGLPDSYNGENYKIGDYAFYRCSSLTAITIPEGVTSIGNYAFYDCYCLTAINIPEGVTSIGEGAFRGCSRLTAINIPEGVTSIGYDAFFQCFSLTAVHISSIEAWCKISFGSYDTNPLAYAHNLYLNGELVTELVIPEGVTSIGERAFEGCRSLTAINIPENSKLTSIGNYAFYYCRSLTAINIPEGVTSIGWYAFEGCSKLTAINIPKSVTSIGANAFYYCTSLTAITIPESVTSIEYGVFHSCSSLTDIVLPKSVKNVGSYAFANCPELTDVYCYAETVPSAELEAFDGSYIEYATLHVPASALDSYRATAPWSKFGNIVALTDEDMGVEQLTMDNARITIYDLHGRRVATPTKDGIYIINGRKVVVKIGM